jgi:thiol reductant ABC exporter CydD subunit
MRPLDPRLLRLSRPARRYLILTVAVGLATAVLVLLLAWTVATAVARAQLGHAHLSDLRTPIGVLLVVILLRAALSGVQETAGHRAGARVKSHLRAAVLERASEPGWRSPVSTGAQATLVTRGIDALDGYVAKFLPQLVLACIIPVVVLVQISLVDWVSGVVVAVTLPLVPVFMVLIGLQTQKHTERHWRSLSVLASHFLDVTAGLPTLKVFGRARAQAAEIDRVGNEHRTATMGVLRIAFLSAFVLELVASLSVAVVAVGVGLRLLDGRLDLRTALVVLILAPEAYLPIRNVGAAFHSSTEGLTAANEVFALLESPSEPARSTVLPDLSAARVTVTGVRVSGDDRGDDRLALASLVLEPGETVAVTGGSGSGKSTLLAVLLGACRPAEGAVLVGDRDLADIDTATWQERVAWLPQRALLFTGTLGENVRMGEPDATDSQVTAALAAAAADFVAGLPHGLETSLGEGGAGLSAGERQRVALARVILRIRRRNCVLVLLDEPTAHLDGATETRVVQSLMDVCANRTTVVATHRPAPASVADHVYPMGAAPQRPRATAAVIS